MRRYTLLFLLALSLRLVVLYELRDVDPIPIGTDMHTYYRLALAPAWPPTGVYSSQPLMPLFIRASFGLFGVSTLSPRLLNCFVGAALVPVVYAIGHRLYGPRVGLLAGLGVALYRAGVVYSTAMLDTTVSSLVLAAAVLACLRNRDGVAGLWLFLGALGRPTLLVAAAGLALWKRSAVLLSVLILCLLPLIWRNAHFGQPALVSTTGPVNLWIGNHPGARGNYDVCPDCPSYAAYRAVVEGERDWTRRVLIYVITNPLDWLAITARKALAFLFLPDAYLPQNISLHEQAAHSRILWLLPGYGFFVCLGLTGLIVQRHRWRDFLPLAWWYAPYATITVLFFVTARFRVPIVPVFILLCAVAVEDIIHRSNYELPIRETSQ